MCLGKTSTSTIARYGIKMIALLYNHEIAGESIPSVPRMLLGEEMLIFFGVKGPQTCPEI